jgi:hypothetical protein
MVYLEALEIVDAEARGRKEDSIDDVVMWMAAMMLIVRKVSMLDALIRKDLQWPPLTTHDSRGSMFDSGNFEAFRKSLQGSNVPNLN